MEFLSDYESVIVQFVFEGLLFPRESVLRLRKLAIINQPHGLVTVGSCARANVVVARPVFYSEVEMQDRTETLGIGSTAPDFSLTAANREGTFVLSQLLRRGPVLVEFMRGTW
jgi:hypothetical protein